MSSWNNYLNQKLLYVLKKDNKLVENDKIVLNMTMQQLNTGEMEPRELTISKILARKAERKKKEAEDVLK